MENKKNNTKLYVSSFLVFMFILSLIVGWLIGTNMSSDTSKERLVLTKEYKKIKDLNYSYNNKKGKLLYTQLCSKCHQSDGQGTMQFPPLKEAKILSNKNNLLLKIIVRGFRGKISRHQKSFNSDMPSFKKIPSVDLTHIVNYIRNNFSTQNLVEIQPVEITNTKVDSLAQPGPIIAKELNP